MTTDELVRELSRNNDELHQSERALKAALAAAQKRIAELEAALTNLINAADDGECHLSVDCEAEHRADGCPLCVTLGAARALLSFDVALRREEEGK